MLMKISIIYDRKSRDSIDELSISNKTHISHIHKYIFLFISANTFDCKFKCFADMLIIAKVCAFDKNNYN